MQLVVECSREIMSLLNCAIAEDVQRLMLNVLNVYKPPGTSKDSSSLKLQNGKFIETFLMINKLNILFFQVPCLLI